MRVIARLDIKGPNVIKGVHLDGYRVIGLPERLAETYYKEGADELLFSDMVASLFQRGPTLEVIRKTAANVFIPITVAGGIRNVDDVREVLRAGADKVAINTAAVKNPNLLKDAVRKFGAQCIVASLEVQDCGRNFFEIWTDNGRQSTGIPVLEWAKKVVDLGCGEILLTAIHKEGTGRGFDLALAKRVADAVGVPVILSGGAGSKKDLARAAHETKVSAVAAASLFHYKYAWDSLNDIPMERRYALRSGSTLDNGNVDFMHQGYGTIKDVPVQPCSISEAKLFMKEQGVPVRVSF